MRHKAYAVNVDDMLDREAAISTTGRGDGVGGESAEVVRVRVGTREIAIQLGPTNGPIRSALVDGASVRVAWEREAGAIKLYLDGTLYRIELADAASKKLRDLKAPAKATGEVRLKAPMPGVVQAVKVQVGQAVAKGATLCVLEAMKMQNDIKAERDGVVQQVDVKVGQSVKRGDLLLVLA